MIRSLPFGLNSCMTQQNKGVSKTFNHITKNRVPLLEIKWKRQKNLQFHRLVVEIVAVVVVVVAKEKKKKKIHKIHRRKRNRGWKLTKNADYWPFLALFQGKELFFVLCGKNFLIRPLPFGLNSCMTQKNKGVSKTFYHITKNRVPYLEIKWKRQKNLQFHCLVVQVVALVVVVVAKEKKEEKDTQNTQKKKKQRMKTDKKICG